MDEETTDTAISRMTLWDIHIRMHSLEKAIDALEDEGLDARPAKTAYLAYLERLAALIKEDINKEDKK